METYAIFLDVLPFSFSSVHISSVSSVDNGVCKRIAYPYLFFCAFQQQESITFNASKTYIIKNTVHPPPFIVNVSPKLSLHQL